MLLQPCDSEEQGAPMTEAAPQIGLNENSTCGLAYLTFIPAIIFLVTAPYNQNANVRFHSWQSIFLTVAAIAAMFVHIVLIMVPIIGFFISLLITLGFFILWLILIINAFNGKRINIPLLSDLAAKQAGA
jgi:uncharacterized membrane protein